MSSLRDWVRLSIVAVRLTGVIAPEPSRTTKATRRSHRAIAAANLD